MALTEIAWIQELSVVHHFLSSIVDDQGLSHSVELARDSGLFSERMVAELDKVVTDGDTDSAIIALADARGEADYLEQGSVNGLVLRKVAASIDRELSRVNRIPDMASPAHQRQVQKELIFITQMLNASGVSADDCVTLCNALGRMMAIAQEDVRESMDYSTPRTPRGFSW